MEGCFESERATIRRRNWWLGALALALALGGVALALGAAHVTGALAIVALAPLALFGGVALFRADLARRERLGRVVASQLGLFVDGRRIASAASVRSARILAGDREPPVLRLLTGRGALELRLESVAAAHELLHALDVRGPWTTLERTWSRPAGTGLDGAAFELRSPWLSDARGSAWITAAAVALPLAFPGIGLVLHAHPIVFSLLLVTAFAAAAAIVVAVTARARLALLPDGVSLSWLWRRTTIAWDEIEGARPCEARGPFAGGEEEGVVLLLRSGAVVHLRAADDHGVTAREIAARVAHAILEHDASESFRDAPRAPSLTS